MIDHTRPLEDQFPHHSTYGSHSNWPKWISGEWDYKRKVRHLNWCHVQAKRWQDLDDNQTRLTSTHGRTLVVDKGWMARELMRGNLVFQVQNTKKFRRLLANQPGCILDIGANIGSLSLEYASWGRKVIAFEPDPHAFSLLSRNMAENNASVAIHQIAVGLQPGTMSFNSVRGEGLGQSRIDSAGSFKVEVVNLDSMVFDQIAGIKIDVEGFEWAVTKGGLNTIQQHRPIIQWEANRTAMKRWGWLPVDVVDMLTEIGYTTMAIDNSPFDSNHAPTRDYWSLPHRLGDPYSF